MQCYPFLGLAEGAGPLTAGPGDQWGSTCGVPSQQGGDFSYMPCNLRGFGPQYQQCAQPTMTVTTPEVATTVGKVVVATGEAVQRQGEQLADAGEALIAEGEESVEAKSGAFVAAYGTGYGMPGYGRYGRWGGYRRPYYGYYGRRGGCQCGPYGCRCGVRTGAPLYGYGYGYGY